METPATPNARPLTEAGRIGRLSFFAATTLQMLVMVFFFFSFMWLVYTFDMFQHRTDERSFIEYLTSDLKMDNISIAFLAASITYIAMATWSGRWAGRRIIVHRKPYGWIGLLTLLMPAIFATIVGVNAVSLYLEGNLFFQGKDFENNVVEPGMLFFAMLYLPGIIVGILGGLFTRQMGRRAGERSKSSLA
jgi:hypothetical protein